jgi:hypothetical protein
MFQKILSLSIFVSTFIFASEARAQNFRLTPENLKFEYISFDSEIRYHCQHKLENAASQDWLVECRDDFGSLQKQYRVHLWVTGYHRAVAPKLSYEILYWLSDLMQQPATGHGSTTWLNLKEGGELHSISVNQSVDGNVAGLYLDIGL